MSRNEINRLLQAIDNLKGYENSRDKGEVGERVVLRVIEDYLRENNYKAALWQSVHYPVFRNLGGNYKWRDGKLLQSDSTDGEIDVLLVTEYRIFIIEVKTYNQYVQIYDTWMKKGKSPNSMKDVEWCNLTQVEKSARHMYKHLLPLLPNGSNEYIVPILVYAQGSIKVDTRDYSVCILDSLKKTLNSKPPLEYRLDFNKVVRKISEKTKGVRIL